MMLLEFCLSVVQLVEHLVQEAAFTLSWKEWITESLVDYRLEKECLSPEEEAGRAGRLCDPFRAWRGMVLGVSWW